VEILDQLWISESFANIYNILLLLAILLYLVQQFRLNSPTAGGGFNNGTDRHQIGRLGSIFLG
jgi:hypothetical protein